jgi:hypothetical protein
MTQPKFCKTCKYSEAEDTWSSLRCSNHQVNAENPWALAYIKHNGSECLEERRKTSWFAKCGIKGKLYEPK